MKSLRVWLALLSLLVLVYAGNAVAAVQSGCLSYSQQLNSSLPSAPAQSSGGGGPSAAPVAVAPRVQAAPVPEVAGGGVSPPAVAAPGCPCCGIIWHVENQKNAETYSESPIGGLQETCWITGQVWTDQPQPERWTFIIRPGTVIWIAGHRGGTAWLFAGDEGAAWEDAKKQARELEERDGPMTTGILMLPDQADQFRLLVRLETNLNPGPLVSSGGSVAASTGGLGEITGPAIVESSLDNGLALVVKLNVGQKRQFSREGSSFPFPDQTSLDSRWETHLAEFFQKHPDGQVQ